MAKIEKYSFHASGICRSAFTTEHGSPQKMTDRAMFKWKRLPTPPGGEGRASRAAWIAFPTDYLSRPTPSEVEGVVWIKAAPAGGATYIEFAFTRESLESIETAFRQRGERELLAHVGLANGDAFFGTHYHADWDNKNLNMPGDGQVADLVFSPRDPYDTGRPIRIRFGRSPSDGDALVLQELGGYPVLGHTRWGDPGVNIEVQAPLVRDAT